MFRRSLLLASLLFALLPGPAEMATFTILARQNRSQPATSPGNSLGRGTSNLLIRLDCPTWASQGGKSIDVLIEQSPDGVEWRFLSSTTWFGNEFSRDGSMPAIFFNSVGLSERRVRVTVTPSAPINFGLDGEDT